MHTHTHTHTYIYIYIYIYIYLEREICVYLGVSELMHTRECSTQSAATVEYGDCISAPTAQVS